MSFNNSFIPSALVLQDTTQIHITISDTDAIVKDQGDVYNQASFTYNQVGVDYGGVYNVNQDVIPLFVDFESDFPINLSISQTNALLENQGYIYNQAGFTYNQPSVMYGGLWNNNWDSIPLLIDSKNIIPSIASITDIYTPFVPTPPGGNRQSLGPGFFMFITH